VEGLTRHCKTNGYLSLSNGVPFVEWHTTALQPPSQHSSCGWLVGSSIKLSHVVVNGGTDFTNEQKIDTNTANSTNIIAQLCIITSMNFISYLLSNKKETVFQNCTNTTTAPSFLPSLQLIDDNNLECLPFDLFVHHVLPFVGSDQYMYKGNFSQEFQNEYHTAEYIPKGIKMNSSVLLPGNLNFLRYIWRKRSCKRDFQSCKKSAANGHFEILQWAHVNGCPWYEDTCANAALSGRLEILQWVRSNGCKWNEDTCTYAAEFGHFEILQWAQVNGCPWNEGTCCGAAVCGNLKMLQWARACGCPWDATTCSRAAANGHTEILQWAHVNGCPWDTSTCSFAAAHGHLEILQWARVNGCRWNENTCANAAEYGYFKLLRWAHVNGCPWDEDTCAMAAKKRYWGILVWARCHGCPWDIRVCDSVQWFCCCEGI
jgi:hypothetical protein